MIDFTNLNKFIIEFIESNSTIIYFGVGTKFYSTNKSDEWDFKSNQQFPPFIHDAKLKYFDKKILIILIDPAFDDNLPYIVSSSNNFLENSWIRSCSHTNLFESSFGISVVTLNQCINWGIYRTHEHNSSYIDIEPILMELCEFIGKPNINSILFYHEFTGKNVILLENSIKRFYNYDDTKICIDITRGSDLSCYFNLTNPENYPIITIDENTNKLKYLNPSNQDIRKLTEIISKYKKYNFDSGSGLFDRLETNYLIDKPEELILYFQIVKLDSITIELIENCLVTMIRQFYTMENKKNFGMGMWGVKYFDIIKSKFIEANFYFVEEKFKIIDDINLNSDNSKDYELIFEEIKSAILEELYNILKSIFNVLLLKYNIDEDYIGDFINRIKNLENKYEFVNYYKNFINLVTK